MTWAPDLSKIITAEQKIADARAELLGTFQTAVQGVLDAAARTKSYTDANTLASYTFSTYPVWHVEATVFLAWRDDVWRFAYAELDKVQKGEEQPPTLEDFLSRLPVIVWPVQ